MARGIGEEIVSNDAIDIITFIGSVAFGKLISSKARFKRMAFELGGDDPLIILNDLNNADLNKAASIAVAEAAKIPASAVLRSNNIGARISGRSL